MLWEFPPLLAKWESLDREGKRWGCQHPNNRPRAQSVSRGNRSRVRRRDGGSQSAGAATAALSTLFLSGQVLSERVSVSHSTCPTLCVHVDCSPPGSSVHGILQAGILEWVASSFSGESSPPRDQTRVSCIAGGFFVLGATREALGTVWGGSWGREVWVVLGGWGHRVSVLGTCP